MSLNLASGKNYSIVFWADAPGNSYYTYTASSKELKVNYSGNAQDENRDAFTVYEPTFKVTGPINKEITLKRPFAQINVGTDDVEAAKTAGVEVKKTGMKVTGVYNTLNLATGAVSGETDVTYAQAAIPSGETFPVEGSYSHNSWLRFRSGASYTVSNCEFSFHLSGKEKFLRSGGMERVSTRTTYTFGFTYGQGDIYLSLDYYETFSSKPCIMRTLTETQYYTSLERSYGDPRRLTVSLTYTFGFGKKVNRNIDTSRGSAAKTGVVGAD